MASIADITVKAANGTTDVVYNALVPSSGDNSPAVWQATAASSVPAGRPELRLSTKSNGTRSSRQVKIDFTYPVLTTNALDGTKSVQRVNFTTSGSLPVLLDQSVLNEASYQFGNLLAAALVKQSMATGYAPT